MEITSPEAMAKFADDVRRQEEPFIAAATEAFTTLFGAEYKRLRAAALESGESAATLHVSVRCDFSPKSRTVEIVTTPAPTQPKPRRQSVDVTTSG
jgi:hypothetical protein